MVGVLSSWNRSICSYKTALTNHGTRKYGGMRSNPSPASDVYRLVSGLRETIRAPNAGVVASCHDNIGPQHDLVAYPYRAYSEQYAPIGNVDMGTQGDLLGVVETDIASNPKVAPARTQEWAY